MGLRGEKKNPGWVVMGLQVHSDLTRLLEEVRRDQPMGLLLARAGVSREVIGIMILIEVITMTVMSGSDHQNDNPITGSF